MQVSDNTEKNLIRAFDLVCRVRHLLCCFHLPTTTCLPPVSRAIANCYRSICARENTTFHYRGPSEANRSSSRAFRTRQIHFSSEIVASQHPTSPISRRHIYLYFECFRNTSAISSPREPRKSRHSCAPFLHNDGRFERLHEGERLAIRRQFEAVGLRRDIIFDWRPGARSPLMAEAASIPGLRSAKKPAALGRGR